MQNLVINAIQAMPQGGVVSVACENVQLPAESPLPLEAGRYVKVSVVDRGGGILAEHLARVFDPYFTTKREGSGLGLATVYSIVKSHGGHVAVRSVVGRGTTFEVYLPATQLAAQRAEPPALEARSGGGRVLVMDDDPAVRSVARNMLARLGYEVSCATEGSEAVEAFRRAAEGGRAYDAVLVDLTVPGGMGGVETVARLRAIDPAVRAVATSGYSGDGAMARFREQGFAAVVAKPYTLEELGRAVGEAVRGRRGEGITRAP
jgi:CheY-like chemotaxis protein